MPCDFAGFCFFSARSQSTLSLVKTYSQKLKKSNLYETFCLRFPRLRSEVIIYMAMNPELIRRPSDRELILAAVVLFPLLVLIGYFRTYYFSPFFDVPSLANKLVHLHGITMTTWVLFFVVQITLVRTKNVKIHMSMGLFGIALAAIVVAVGMATAYDAQLVRGAAPPGVNPHSFFVLPAGDMAMFVVFFAWAIYHRKHPTEHKVLMVLTAINFLPAAFYRATFIPLEYLNIWAFGLAYLIAIAGLVWHSLKNRKVNKTFLAAVILFVVSAPLRFVFAETEIWHQLTRWLAS